MSSDNNDEKHCDRCKTLFPLRGDGQSYETFDIWHQGFVHVLGKKGEEVDTEDFELGSNDYLDYVVLCEPCSKLFDEVLKRWMQVG